MNESIGKKKVSLGVVLLVLFLLGAGFVAILVKMGGGETKIDKALAIMKRQVAADIALQASPADARINDWQDDFYFVCGTATLNRPNAGALTLDNVSQRYIVTVKRSTGAGVAKFDGSASPEGRAEFAREWDDFCQAAEAAP